MTKQKGQKGKVNADTTKKMMAAEEMKKALNPTNRQNSEQ